MVNQKGKVERSSVIWVIPLCGDKQIKKKPPLRGKIINFLLREQEGGLIYQAVQLTSKKKEGDHEWVKEILTEYELIVDSTEQPIERPENQEEQEKFYSGKKQNHTRKNQLIILPQGEDIVDVKVGAPGPTSDINQFRSQ